MFQGVYFLGRNLVGEVLLAAVHLQANISDSLPEFFFDLLLLEGYFVLEGADFGDVVFLVDGRVLRRVEGLHLLHSLLCHLLFLPRFFLYGQRPPFLVRHVVEVLLGHIRILENAGS